MMKPVINDVTNQTIGYVLILSYFFDQTRIQRIIDENVPRDVRWKILPYGPVAIAVIAAIFSQVLQRYQICQFANKSYMLLCPLSQHKNHECFVDHLILNDRIGVNNE
jgi:hypothetical protein